MKTRLADVMVCPCCRGPLLGTLEDASLRCPVDRLAFPVVDGIPFLLPQHAKPLDEATAAS